MPTDLRRAISGFRRDAATSARWARGILTARQLRHIEGRETNRRIGALIDSLELVLLVLLIILGIWLHDRFETPVWLLALGWVAIAGLVLWLDETLWGIRARPRRRARRPRGR